MKANAMNERRSNVRQKSFMQGRLYFNHRQSSMDCNIRNFSDMGARLEFPETTSLPDSFEVHIPSKNQYFQARAIWHDGADIGVAWLPEEAPSATPASLRSGDPIGDRLAKLEHEVAIIRKRLEVMS